jgi:DNA-directed RNA polymerase subunit RPC12/RpoP
MAEKRKRICPTCGLELHSADAVKTWTCPRCNGKVPVPERGEGGENVKNVQ